jgi:hypothetical protein
MSFEAQYCFYNPENNYHGFFYARKFRFIEPECACSYADCERSHIDTENEEVLPGDMALIIRHINEKALDVVKAKNKFAAVLAASINQ